MGLPQNLQDAVNAYGADLDAVVTTQGQAKADADAAAAAQAKAAQSQATSQAAVSHAQVDLAALQQLFAAALANVTNPQPAAPAAQ